MINKSFNLLKVQMPVKAREEVDERLKQEILKIHLQEAIVLFNDSLVQNRINTVKSINSLDKFLAVLPFFIKEHKIFIVDK